MLKITMSPAASNLIRALIARAGVPRDRILLTDVQSTDWQSLTLTGERHQLELRVCAPHSGQISCTLDACSDASRSTMPPLMLRPGFGLVWRLIMFTPSTTRRLAAGTIFNTRPRLPRSLPAMTSTLSFFRIGD